MSVLPDPRASRAVLVGTSHYQHLEQLPAVSNNLQALAGLLSDPPSLHLPAQHVTVVENPAAAHTVVRAVRQAAAEATDTLVVYFAGHGLIDPQDMLSLALPHTKFGHIETALPYDWLRQVLLLDSRAERHVVILDCCYSGLALGRMSASPGLADQAAVEGSFLLAAAAETRTALAPVGDTYTAFTGALLDTLRHGIPGGPALLDLGTIYRHLRLTLEARGHPVPQARDRNSGAQVALGRNHAALPAPPTSAPPGTEASRRPRTGPPPIRTGPDSVPAPQEQPGEHDYSLQAADAQHGSHSAYVGIIGEHVDIPGQIVPNLSLDSPETAPACEGHDLPASSIESGSDTIADTPENPATTSENVGWKGRTAALLPSGLWGRPGNDRGLRVALVGTTCLALLTVGGWLTWNNLHKTQKRTSGAPSSSAPNPSTSPLPKENALVALENAKKGKGEFVIGVKDDQPGLSENEGTKENPNWTGAEIEYAKLIVKILGIPEKGVRFSPLGSGSREDDLKGGFVQIVVGTYGINEEREKEVDFAGPYYQTKQKILLRKGQGDDEAYFRDKYGVQKSAKVTSIADLKENLDTPLCTVEKSTSVGRLKEQGFTNVATRADYMNCMKGLRTAYSPGRYKYDGVVTDEPILKGLKKASERKNGGAELMIARDGFGAPERYGIGLAKGNPTLKAQICDAIRKIKAETTRELYKGISTEAVIPSPDKCLKP
ncbi:transporter substrate-binding domain-containing protein [Streptomyces sp. NPDC087218]|uniref:caspase, EACC1-associated type n=1 Tax=Streptomyces sp. NPDC087218 TaxID=3365769 RepID=UPI003807D5C1